MKESQVCIICNAIMFGFALHSVDAKLTLFVMSLLWVVAAVICNFAENSK